MADDPGDGHTFRVGVDVRASYQVLKEGEYRDAGEFDQLPVFVEVRAWDLREALHKAADLPLSEWFKEDS